mgnify:CR=1 FL=1
MSWTHRPFLILNLTPNRVNKTNVWWDRPIYIDYRLGGALAVERNLSHCLGPRPAAGENCLLFYQRISGTSHRSIFHAAKSSQMPYTAIVEKSKVAIILGIQLY